jgi:hypothetical protein
MKRHYSNKSVNHCLFCFFIIVTNMLLMTIVDDTFGLGPCASVPCGEPIYDPEGHFIRCKTCSEGGCEGACVNVNGQRMCRPCGGDDNKECCDIFHCCPAGHCCGSTCYDPATQGCCNGQPYDLATEQCCYDQPTPYKIPLNQECCHGDHCNTPQCKYCGFNYETWEYECMNMCDPEKCQTCDGQGHCVFCNGEPNQQCYNGRCYPLCKLTNGEVCADPCGHYPPCNYMCTYMVGDNCVGVFSREYKGWTEKICSGGCPDQCDPNEKVCYTQTQCQTVWMPVVSQVCIAPSPAGGCKQLSENNLSIWCFHCEVMPNTQCDIKRQNDSCKSCGE